MTREKIRIEMKKIVGPTSSFSYDAWPIGYVEDFVVAQINAALEEAANVNLDRSMREQYVAQGPRCLATAANRIRALKIAL